MNLVSLAVVLIFSAIAALGLYFGGAPILAFIFLGGFTLIGIAMVRAITLVHRKTEKRYKDIAEGNDKPPAE